MNKKRIIWIIMLNISAIILIIIGLFFAVSNKIICNSKGVADRYTITQKYYIKHHDNAITRVIVYKKYNFIDREQYKKLEQLFVQTINNYKQITNKNIDVKNLKVGNNYFMILNANIENLTAENIQTIGLTDSLDELKTNLENQGLTCK